MEQQDTGSDTLMQVWAPEAMNWLYQTIQGIVDDETAARVECDVHNTGAVLKLRVNPADQGKVIGKHGSMARALRTMLHARGRKLGVVFSLNIVDDAPRVPTDRDRMVFTDGARVELAPATREIAG